MGDTLHIKRVENLLGAGTPDVEGFVKQHEVDGEVIPRGQFWLELKSHVRPARPATPIRFPLKGREEQIRFMRERWFIGGNAFFLLQVGEGAERTLYLARGTLGELLRAGMTESEIAVECAQEGAIFRRGVTPAEVVRRAVTARRFF
jgi:hypothetical protein